MSYQLRWWFAALQAFVDHEGSVVLSFDRAAAALEGDLTAYLNHQEKHGSTMVEFRSVCWVADGPS